MRGGKAQASIEYIIVLAASLAFLAAWLPACENARERILSRSAELEAQAALDRIASSAEEAYLLGEGNSQQVDASPLAGATIRISGGLIQAGFGGKKLNASGRFKADEKTLQVQGQNKKLLVACCSRGGVTLNPSTGPP